MSPRRTAALFLAAAGAGAGLLAPTSASAAGPAVHYTGCADGTTFTSTVEGWTFSYCFDDVATPSGNANAHFRGDLVDGQAAPAKAVTVRGFACSASYPSGGDTTDTRLVVSPSGNVSGTCKFR